MHTKLLLFVICLLAVQVIFGQDKVSLQKKQQSDIEFFRGFSSDLIIEKGKIYAERGANVNEVLVAIEHENFIWAQQAEISFSNPHLTLTEWDFIGFFKTGPKRKLMAHYLMSFSIHPNIHDEVSDIKICFNQFNYSTFENAIAIFERSLVNNGEYLSGIE